MNVGPSLAEKYNKELDKKKCDINVTSSFSFSWVSQNEVKRLIKEICITKSSAVDEINTRLLKDAFEVLSYELTYLNNSCLQNGIFPEMWTTSKVTPIPKTSYKSTKPGDWRPISQISLPGKLLEKIIHAQLEVYLDGNDILTKKQFGFPKGLSTSSAIFEVLKSLGEGLNIVVTRIEDKILIC